MGISYLFDALRKIFYLALIVFLIAYSALDGNSDTSVVKILIGLAVFVAAYFITDYLERKKIQSEE